MKATPDSRGKTPGDQLVHTLAALANPHRVRILAALHQGRKYVSQLAREVELSRPLVHMHLQRLEAVGIVKGALELSTDGKAMKFFEVVPFAITLSPEVLAEAGSTVSLDRNTKE